MGKETFEAAVEHARLLERKMMEYSPYKGGVEIEATLDLEPKEYVELGYKDMLNLYERSQKIISTAGMGILEHEERKAAPSAKSEEVESRLREITTETLKKAEEVAKEEIVEREVPPVEEEIELERPPEKIEIEKPEVPEIEIERPPEKKAERAPKVEVPVERKAAPPPPPPVLRESPDEVASRRYQQMEEQIRTTLGERADRLTLKKKMLDLTKQLFKEKSTSRREEIKLQITVLKNMLIAAKERPGARKRKDETHAKLLDTMLSTQQAEIARTKDEIVGTYNKKIAEIKKKFYDDISMAEKPAKRKQIYEGFVFSVTSLVEQLPDAIKERKDLVVKKHTAEMERLKGSVSKADKETLAKVDERIGYIKSNYGDEFSAVKGIVGREMDNLIEVTGGEIFKEPEEKPKDEETIAHEVVKEINELDEGTLLYRLHSKDPAYYKQYERKKISRAEAIFKAKALYAKEKGLSDSMVKKYFSQTED
jgi:hypothetical protein